jgi:hypothetical protein
MEQILLKGDVELYHEVKLMEMAKIEDKLLDEFSLVEMDFLKIYEILRIDDDAIT